MSRTKGKTSKPTLFNNELQKTGLTTEAFHNKMDSTLLNLECPFPLYPPVPLNSIRLLKSGAKNIIQTNVLTVLKLCYTLNCSPNDVIPNIMKGETGAW